MNRIETSVIKKARSIIDTFLNAANATFVYMALAGSRGRGAHHENSDHDIFFVYQSNHLTLTGEKTNITFRHEDIEFIGVSFDTWMKNIASMKHQFLEATFAFPLDRAPWCFPDGITGYFSREDIQKLVANHVHSSLGLMGHSLVALKKLNLQISKVDFTSAIDLTEDIEKAKLNFKYARYVLWSALYIANAEQGLTSLTLINAYRYYSDQVYPLLDKYDEMVKKITPQSALDDMANFEQAVADDQSLQPYFFAHKERGRKFKEMIDTTTTTFDYEGYLKDPKKYRDLLGPVDQLSMGLECFKRVTLSQGGFF